MHDDLKALYREGFIAAPNEKPEAFYRRVETVRQLFKNPAVLSEKLSVPIESFKLTKENVLTFTSDKGLFFYHGAMTLICEIEEGINVPIVQLPKKRRLFSFVSREEVIKHERVHTLRAAFHEPLFEEILAYRTSKFKYRQFLGPLFRSRFEAPLFLFLILLSFFGLFFVPLTYFLFLFFRLRYLENIFKKALKKLKEKYLNCEEMVLFLTDREIKEIAKGNYDTIPKTDLRWKQIEKTFEKR